MLSECYQSAIRMLSQYYHSAIRMLSQRYQNAIIVLYTLLSLSHFSALHFLTLHFPKSNVKYFFMNCQLIGHRKNFTFPSSLPITLFNQNLSHFSSFIPLFMRPPLESHNLPAVHKTTVLLFLLNNFLLYLGFASLSSKLPRFYSAQLLYEPR